MKKRNFVLGCLSALFLAFASSAFSGNCPCDVTLTVADAYYHFDNKRNLDNINMPNIALAYNFTRQWAIEGGVGLINTNTNLSPSQGVQGYLYTVDGLYRFFQYGALEPYVSAGVGILSIKPNDHDANQQGNINAGFGAQLFFHKVIAFRAEVKDVYTIIRGKNDYMANLGLSFLFD